MPEVMTVAAIANATRNTIAVDLTDTTVMRRSAAITGAEVLLLKKIEAVTIASTGEMTLLMIVRTVEITKDLGIDVD